MTTAVRTISVAAPTYDVVVVGSGYGGGVAASRMARMGFRVAVLEQGKQWRPGDFPTTAKARRKTTRLTGRVKLGDPRGLYDFSVGHGLTVFGATGLGGGSLINAGVTLRPDLARLRRHGWPKPVTDDGLLSDGLAQAEHMLGVAPAPEPERFGKFRGMGHIASAAGLAVQAPPMTITHAPGTNAAGVMQYACRNCGDCWSGCNVGAKNTIGITYLADARAHGAEVFCEARCETFSRTPAGWSLDVRDLATNRIKHIQADQLVLAAGTLGTNQLLLRAKARGLPLSDALGTRFSANGDDLVVASDLPLPVHAIATGFPSQAPPGATPVGPHSMALIDVGDGDGPCWMHDGTMLRVMAALTPYKDLLEFSARSAWRIWRQGIYGDDMSRIQLIYVVADDDASGRLALQKDRIVVDWPAYSTAQRRLRAEQKVKAVIERAGGTFNDNPFAMAAFGGNRIIAHPLGGAPMADSSDRGVVAPDGRVYDPTRGHHAIYDGLYVTDGAAIPSSVGVSPLLTITALAERAMRLAAERLGRPLDLDRRPPVEQRDALM